MATTAYYRWVAAGKPLQPAQPVRDVVDRLKAAYPRSASLFGWYANDAHYQAVPAEDHTPFSQTGWPQASPEWWVFATDVMHRPDLGADCNVLFPYWIGEARAGRFPGLKYLIWQARIYDVRYGWREQSSSDHFDHIHLSFRTDWQTKSLGSWSLLPGGTEVDMDFNQSQKLDGIFNLADAVKLDTDGNPDGKGSMGNFPVPLTVAVKTLMTDVAALKAKPAGSVTLTAADRAAIVTDLLAALKPEIRDAVADLGEGGAAQVRADA